MIWCRWYDDDNSNDYDYEVYEEFCDDDDVDDGNADNNIVPSNLHEWIYYCE